MYERYINLKDWLFNASWVYDGHLRGKLAAFALHHLPVTKTEHELETNLFG